MKNFNILLNNSFEIRFPNLDSILNQALQNTSEYLRQFRFDAGYTQKLETAFGNDFNRSVANQIFDKLAQGDFSGIPTIEIVNRNDINGANGAFAIATGKIYLAADFISQNAQNVNAVAAVLLEEYGHFVDSRINTKDAAGDEGDIFARLVQGKSISQQELEVLRAEDDKATVTLDGVVVEIEQNNIRGTAGNDTLYGTNLSDIIEGLAGNDTIYGEGGNDRIYTWYNRSDAGLVTVKYGNNTAYGQGGNDIIEGDNGTDKLYGGEDNDILNGWGGNDTLDGGNGDDILYATAGIDRAVKKIWGGTGSDTFILDAKEEIKTTLNFNVEQLIEFNNALSSTDTKWWRILKDIVFLGLGAAFPAAGGFSYLGNIAANEGFNLLDAQTKKENAKRLLQEYPSDSWGKIVTSGTRDIILIEDFEIGIDTIVLPNLKNLPNYSYGLTEAFEYSSNGVFVYIREGNNTHQNIAFIKTPTDYSTNNNNNLTFGNLIKQMIDATAGIISVYNAKPVEGDRSDQPDINGTAAYDIINGLEGNDHIEGKAGNDIINGGDGSDELWGGEGSDVFLYDSFSYSGIDTIKDFNAQQGDKILVNKLAFTGSIDKTKFSYNTTTNTLSFNGKNLAVLNANSGFNLQRDLIIEAEEIFEPAEIFEHENYQGRSLTLNPGKYDVNDLTSNGFGYKILSSLKLPNGWSVLLCSGAGFTGNKKVYTSDQLYVGNDFDDQTTSLVIADGYAEVFEHGDYRGRSLKLAPGEYDLTDLFNLSGGAGFDAIISSLILPDGWRATLYDWSTLEGKQKVFNSSSSSVGNDWNDRACSLKVEAPNVLYGTLNNDILNGGAGNDILNGGAGNDILVGDPVTVTFGAAFTALTNFSPAQGWNSFDKYPRQLADVNGDGRADIVGFGSDAVYVALGQTDGKFGATKVAFDDGVSFTVNDGGWNSFDKYPRQLADVNGDGRADIVGFGSDAVYVALGQTDGKFGATKVAFDDGVSFTVNDGGWNSFDKYPRQLGDVNGDGRADIVGFGLGAVVVALGQTNGTFQTISGYTFNNFATQQGWNSFDQYPRQLADVNGDGRSDIVGFDSGAVHVALAQPNGNDTLNGGAGKDTLTGGLGADRFDYRNLADSVFNTFDVITDFNAKSGNDLFVVSTARTGFNNVGTVATFDTTGITAKLTNTTFAANAAAQFSFGSRTFVAINDATAGFGATTDAIIEVTGLTGTLGLNNFTTTLA